MYHEILALVWGLVKGLMRLEVSRRRAI